MELTYQQIQHMDLKAFSNFLVTNKQKINKRAFVENNARVIVDFFCNVFFTYTYQEITKNISSILAIICEIIPFKSDKNLIEMRRNLAGLTPNYPAFIKELNHHFIAIPYHVAYRNYVSTDVFAICSSTDISILAEENNPSEMIKNKVEAIATDFSRYVPIEGDGNCYYRSIYVAFIERCYTHPEERDIRFTYLTDLINKFLLNDAEARYRKHIDMLNGVVTFLANVIKHDPDYIDVLEKLNKPAESASIDDAFVWVMRLLTDKFIRLNLEVVQPDGRPLDEILGDTDIWENLLKDKEYADGPLVELAVLPHILGFSSRTVILGEEAGLVNHCVNACLSSKQHSLSIQYPVDSSNNLLPFPEVALLLRTGRQHYDLLQSKETVESLVNLIVIVNDENNESELHESPVRPTTARKNAPSTFPRDLMNTLVFDSENSGQDRVVSRLFVKNPSDILRRTSGSDTSRSSVHNQALDLEYSEFDSPPENELLNIISKALKACAHPAAYTATYIACLKQIRNNFLEEDFVLLNAEERASLKDNLNLLVNNINGKLDQISGARSQKEAVRAEIDLLGAHYADLEQQHPAAAADNDLLSLTAGGHAAMFSSLSPLQDDALPPVSGHNSFGFPGWDS